MDDTTNGRHRSPVPEPTPEGRARLLTALDLERARHPVDPGQLGEYVELLDHVGLTAARAAFPSVAAHLAAGCDACNDELCELRAIAALDESDADRADSAPRPDADIGRIAAVPPPSPLAPTNPASPLTATVAARRRRQRRVLMTGLTAVAAVAMVIMGASLYALLSLAPRGGTGEIKLVARETLTPAAPPATTTVAASPGPSGAAGQPQAGATSGSAETASAAPAGNDCPDSHPVKANRESRIYHLRGGAFYDRTRPEVCYATAEDAERAGYRRSQR